MQKDRTSKWLQKIIRLHDEIIRIYGGATGIIDAGLLESTLVRPFTGTADGEEFFPTEIDKTAALLEGIIIFHPFVDGNKRTATIFAFEFLRECGYKIEVEPEEIVTVAIKIAIKGFQFSEIKDWLSKITKAVN